MVEEDLFKLLLKRGKTLATAESCTGGLLAHRLTNVPGVSEVFLLGVISYSNEAKVKVIGVEAEVIEAIGAVSAEVAIQMAEGIRNLAGSDLGIGITGIAGPSGGSREKPVGTVYMGLSYPEKGVSESRLFHFTGDRVSVKTQTAEAAFQWLYHALKNS
jgi:nicotinamide-nucleotide amidase